MSDPIVKRGTLRTTLGVEVSSLEVTLIGGDDVSVAGASLGQFALDGGFDGAELVVSRNFAPDWESPSAGNLNMFVGRVAEMTITGTEVVLTVNNPMELLNVQMPRNIFGAGCIRTLYTPGCNLNAADFTEQTAVSGNSSTRFAVETDSGHDDGYYDLGTITGNTGLNAGVKRTVKSFTVGTFRVAFPFPYVPADGDTFDVKPGCDKLLTTCENKFSNRENFRGFPFIPAPESTV